LKYSMFLSMQLTACISCSTLSLTIYYERYPIHTGHTSATTIATVASFADQNAATVDYHAPNNQNSITDVDTAAVLIAVSLFNNYTVAVAASVTKHSCCIAAKLLLLSLLTPLVMLVVLL
jgi:hypothetical protein